jgi:FMN phosphatase YigB (HAD superfamily)
MKKPEEIKCIIFDYANTLSSDLYFQSKPIKCPEWRHLFDKYVFADKLWLTEWCNGRKKTEDIALRIKEYVDLPLNEIIDEMKKGCQNLTFNEAVLNFAKSQSANGRKTALVTANIDMFSDTVVQSHNLNEIFDTIVNSADYGTDDKRKLWPIAFQLSGNGIDYACSLLIDDSEKWIQEFINMGGSAYKYSDDSAFLSWLSRNHIQKTTA